MFYNFLRNLFNIFIFFVRLFEKLLDKPNLVILYPFLYFFYMFCAFHYGLTSRADSLLCTFIAWVPFTTYLIELKFFKKRHGVSFYFVYGLVISFLFIFFDFFSLSLRPILYYLFWGYFCFMSQAVSVAGWSMFIFLVEYFHIAQTILRIIFLFFFFFFYSLYQLIITLFLFFKLSFRLVIVCFFYIIRLTQ